MTDPVTPCESGAPNASLPPGLTNLPDLQDPRPALLDLLATLGRSGGITSPAIPEAQAPSECEPSADGPSADSPPANAGDDPASARAPLPTWFVDAGDAVLLLGEPVDLADPYQGLGGSAYLRLAPGAEPGPTASEDPEVASTLRTTLAGLLLAGGMKSVRAVQSGGLAVALAAGCLRPDAGAETGGVTGVVLDLRGLGHATPVAAEPPSGEVADATPAAASAAALVPRADALLFGETPSRVVVSCGPLDATKIVERAKLLGVPACRVGTVGGEVFRLGLEIGDFDIPSAELRGRAEQGSTEENSSPHRSS